MPQFFSQLLFRYKLLYVVLLLFFSLVLLFLYDDEEMQFWPQWAAWLVVVGFCALAAWIVVRWLVPALLYKKRKAAFIGWLSGIALVNSILIYMVSGVLYVWLTGEGPVFTDWVYFVYMVGFFFLANIVVIGVACLLRFIADRFRMEDRLAKIEKEKVTTELAFLRGQTNPHFLFNVLNTIYFQIRPDNAPARDSVEKLAEILRYQLYECNTDLIEIEKEVANMRNYVAMQQLRLEPDTKVQLEVDTNVRHFKIAPLLLLPLVENAFKHLSHFRNPADNQLSIHLSHKESRRFVAEVRNTYDDKETTMLRSDAGGVGLHNVKRRLELLYPAKHELAYSGDGSVYCAKIMIAYDDSVFIGRRRADSPSGDNGIHQSDTFS